MKIYNLLEQKNEVMNSIKRCTNSFGTAALYGGNCGTFALALSSVHKDLNPTIGILFRDVGDIDDIVDLLNAETDIYHVVVEIGGIMYDGDGIVTSDDLLRLASVEYGDEHPSFFF